MIHSMIQSFKCKDTQALFEGRCPRRWLAIRSVSERKLQLVHRAAVLTDLRSPPGNRLEALKSNRKEQHSIRINDQWRVCFVWTINGPAEVEIVDYH
jgi:proteic killer suppression protein